MVVGAAGRRQFDPQRNRLPQLHQFGRRQGDRLHPVGNRQPGLGRHRNRQHHGLRLRPQRGICGRHLARQSLFRQTTVRQHRAGRLLAGQKRPHLPQQLPQSLRLALHPADQFHLRLRHPQQRHVPERKLRTRPRLLDDAGRRGRPGRLRLRRRRTSVRRALSDPRQAHLHGGSTGRRIALRRQTKPVRRERAGRTSGFQFRNMDATDVDGRYSRRRHLRPGDRRKRRADPKSRRRLIFPKEMIFLFEISDNLLIFTPISPYLQTGFTAINPNKK